MSIVTAVPSLSLSSATPAAASADVLIVGVHPSKGRRKGITTPGTLTAAARRRLEEVAGALGATGKAGEVTTCPGTGITKAPLVIAVGLGPLDNDAPLERRLEGLRRAYGAAARSTTSARRVAIVAPDQADLPDDDVVEATGLGALLGAYSFTAFRGAGTPSSNGGLRQISMLADHRNPSLRAALDRASTIAAAVYAARDLVNTPPSALPPAGIAQAAIDAAADLDISIEVLDEEDLIEGGFGGITAVGQGSANPPRLVSMRYTPAEPVASLAFVGKGITFDSGGLSLKPPKAMETMKCDMSGAAAVIAAVTAIARMELPVEVVGWIPTAENMPSGKAQRPGDVITIYGGRTVEVLNTDAEGRLILADALVRATEDSPDLIVDAATLTGAAVVALGDRTAGIMANDDHVRVAVWESSQRAGETMWHVPIPEESRGTLDSHIADIKNIGDGKGGMLSAAAFLRDFIPQGTRWAHLDIAGPAFNDGGPHGYTPKGGTGSAVRTFIQLAIDAAQGRLP
jgi:leucyl aminopeptidase